MIFSPCEKPVRQEERPYDEAGLRLARSAQKDKRRKYEHKYDGKHSCKYDKENKLIFKLKKVNKYMAKKLTKKKKIMIYVY